MSIRPRLTFPFVKMPESKHGATPFELYTALFNVVGRVKCTGLPSKEAEATHLLWSIHCWMKASQDRRYHPPPQHQQPCDAVNATSIILARGAHSIAPTRHPRGHHPMQRRSDGIGACAGAGPLRFGSVTDGGNWDDLHSAADCVNTDSLFLLRIFLNYHRSSRDCCNACSVKFHARFKLSKKIARLFYQAPVFCEPSNQPPD